MLCAGISHLPDPPPPPDPVLICPSLPPSVTVTLVVILFCRHNSYNQDKGFSLDSYEGDFIDDEPCGSERKNRRKELSRARRQTVVSMCCCG